MACMLQLSRVTGQQPGRTRAGAFHDSSQQPGCCHQRWVVARNEVTLVAQSAGPQGGQQLIYLTPWLAFVWCALKPGDSWLGWLSAWVHPTCCHHSRQCRLPALPPSWLCHCKSSAANLKSSLVAFSRPCGSQHAQQAAHVVPCSCAPRLLTPCPHERIQPCQLL